MVLLYGLGGIRVGEASNPGPPRQLRPGHVALSESPIPVRRSARLQALGSTAGVVDATAVALPSPPEARGVSVVCHADLQGPTQVDSDDEPMVADSTVINFAQPTPSILARNPGLPRHIRSDLTATQVDRAAGVVSEGAVTANRFSLGTEFDSDSSTEEICMAS